MSSNFCKQIERLFTFKFHNFPLSHFLLRILLGLLRSFLSLVTSQEVRMRDCLQIHDQAVRRVHWEDKRKR